MNERLLGKSDFRFNTCECLCFAIFSVGSVGADNIRPILTLAEFLVVATVLFCFVGVGLCSARFSICKRLLFCYIICSLVGAGLCSARFSTCDFFVVAIVIFHSVGAGIDRSI